MRIHCAASCIPVLIQQRVDAGGAFNRSWQEFKVGFNDSRGNYWLGNELLSQLTEHGHYKLRFDLQGHDYTWYYAQYRFFFVSSEATNYTVRVAGYSGNLYNAFGYHNGMMFTTYDRDNDPWTHADRKYKNNCAVYYGGGFWYNKCAHADVTRKYNFRWYIQYGRWRYLKKSRMWLTCC